MPRFLHLADVHLGCDRYDNRRRTQDFFYAFQDAIQRHAIEAQVDFVIIAGDLFEHRNLQPAVLNQAQSGLRDLQQAGIPVIAIEGNHDNRPYGTKTNWLRYLSDWGQLILLEPGDVAAGEPFYSAWDDEAKRGGYIDLDCGVRVLGSQWYGASAPKAIEEIASAIRALPPTDHPQVLLFHHGLEGQIARYQGAMRYNDLVPLRQAGVNYLALGHIHKNYEVEGWIFNPGSTEANTIEEATLQRGVYSVEITPTSLQATLKQDYQQRSALRLKLQLRGDESLEEVEAKAVSTIEQAIQSGRLQPEAEPLVELRLEGRVGFNRLDLDVRRLQQQLQQLSQALIFLLKYEAESLAYESRWAEDASRTQIEQEIFTDLLAANQLYKKRSAQLSQGLIDLKEQQLDGQADPQLYAFVQALLTGPTPLNGESSASSVAPPTVAPASPVLTEE